MVPKLAHKKYDHLINKLIELFEQIQCQEKEKIADAIAKLIEKDLNK
ncbi:MAG: hypothetical protein NZ932_04340 [Candidatus Bathyarchaeota archaeon]|nr:hypothetical protein [Candidatus Bathyarchaeota archaeon]MDW8040484.1 hypothetical protein [Nitrososphaerota archaeon]